MRPIILLGTLVGLFLGAWFVLHSLNQDSSQSTPRAGPPSSSVDWEENLVHRGLAELEGQQRVGSKSLSSSDGAPEPMPNAMRNRISENFNGIGPLQLHFDQAQLVRTARGRGIWIVDGQGVTCIFGQASSAGSCQTMVSANRRGISLGTYQTSKSNPGQPSQFLLVGIAPLGVRVVRLAIKHGPTRTVKVRNGAWALQANKAIGVQRLIR
jgi:hypothetical protein